MNFQRLIMSTLSLCVVASAFADDCERFTDLSYYQTNLPRSRTAISSNAQKTSVTLQGIFFDSDYDNGSIDNVTEAGANAFNCTLFTESGEPGTRKYHFRFKMTGVAGRTITLNIDHTQNRRPFISLDGVTWRRCTAAEAPNLGQLVFSFTASQNFAEVAFFEPLGYSEVHGRVNALVASGIGASTATLGNSFQGRPFWLVTVTDPTVPDTGKIRVWMHARVHAGEVTSSHQMLGFLEKVCENSPEGARLRRYCIFNIVPTLNCDGVHLGLTRWDSQGIDLESQWGTPLRTPEVAAIKARVDMFMTGPNPIQAALNMHSTVNDFADTFFFKHLSPSVTTAFETIQQNYIDAFNNASPLFDNLSPQSSQLDPVRFIESYFWNNWAANVMALTHEGHYYERITDGQYLTGNDYKQLGRDMAMATIQYFNLPAFSSVNDFMLY